MKWILLAAVFSLPVFAEEPQFEVMVDADAYPAKAFSQKGVKAVEMPKKPARGAIPSKLERDAALGSIPELDISALDELDRDRLYVLARTVDFPRLAKSFPKIPEKPLRALHQKLNR